jgi:hypothetical protein
MANPNMAELKVRLSKDEWHALQLYCASGVLSVSASEILRVLLTKFVSHVVLGHETQEFDPDIVIAGIRAAITKGTQEIEAKRAGKW